MEINGDQIIYVEDYYHPEIHNFIKKNRKRIDGYLRQKLFLRLNFFYLPEIQRKVKEHSLQYHYPYLSNDVVQLVSDQLLEMTTAEFSNVLLEHAGFQGEILPGLIRIAKNENGTTYQYTPIEGQKTKDWRKFFEHYIKTQLVIDVPKNEAEAEPKITGKKQVGHSNKISEEEIKFEEIGSSLPKDVLKKIESIEDPKQLEMLMKLLETKLEGLDVSQKLSRIIINQEEIRLPDYKDKVIHLTPLQKSVYILFINHPKGIDLKYLPEYKDELLDIYLRITKRGLIDPIKESIETLTDPFDNSIHEKFSRIKAAFVGHFDENLASHYYITGERGAPKKIILDRDLVELGL